MTTLHETIEARVQNAAKQIAAALTPGIIEALRSATLEEINSFVMGAPRGKPGPKPKAPGAPKGTSASKSAKVIKGRLGRRSPEDIARVLNGIVLLLKSTPSGLRAEEIRAKLGLQKKEFPKPIEDGLASGALKKRGAKRATTYYVGSGGEPSAGSGGKKKTAKKKAAKKKG